MRVVADTNIIISGFFWRGPSHQLLAAVRTNVIELYTSTVLLAELDDVLRRDKFAKRLLLAGVDAKQLLLGYAALAKVVKPTMLVSVVVDDPEDNAVLESVQAKMLRFPNVQTV